MAETAKELIDDIIDGMKKLKEQGEINAKSLRTIIKKSGIEDILPDMRKKQDSFFDDLEKRTSKYASMVKKLAGGESELQKALFKQGTGKKQPFYYYDTEGQKKLERFDLKTIESEYAKKLSEARANVGFELSDKFFPTAQENIIENLFGNIGFRSTSRFLTDDIQDFGKTISDLHSSSKENIKEIDEWLKKYSEEVDKRTDLSDEEKKGIKDEAQSRADYFKKTQEEATEDFLGLATKSIVQKGIEALFKDIARKVTSHLESIYKQAKKTIEDISAYSLSTSYVVDSRARQQALQYGLSDSQNYAFTQTKQLLGISSDEDLFWLNSNQRQKFSELMQKESAIYDTMLSDGTLEGFQELKIDFNVLKQEYMASVVKFLSENKDTIISFMNLGLNALQGILSVVSGIFNIINTLNPLSDKFWFNRITGGSNTTYNITMNNSATATSKEQAESLASGLSERVTTQLKTYFES